MKRIGMPTSDDTILRHLKRRAKANRTGTSSRVVGLDDWAWRKGSTYGTIMVDLERREVIEEAVAANADLWHVQWLTVDPRNRKSATR